MSQTPISNMEFFASDMWSEGRFTKPMALLDLIYLSEVNKDASLKPRQFETTVNKLTARWKISVNTTKSWLDKFQRWGLITVDRTKHATLITILADIRAAFA